MSPPPPHWGRQRMRKNTEQKVKSKGKHEKSNVIVFGEVSVFRLFGTQRRIQVVRCVGSKQFATKKACETLKRMCLHAGTFPLTYYHHQWSGLYVAWPHRPKSQKRFFFASVSNVIQKVRFKPEKVRPYLCLSHRGADRTKPTFGGIAKDNARKREENEHVGSAVQRPKLMPIFLCFPFPRFPVFELESHVPNFDCVPSPDWDFPVRRLFSFVEMRFWPKIQNGPSLPTTTTFTFIPAASLRASSLPRLLCRQI